MVICLLSSDPCFPLLERIRTVDEPGLRDSNFTGKFVAFQGMPVMVQIEADVKAGSIAGQLLGQFRRRWSGLGRTETQWFVNISANTMLVESTPGWAWSWNWVWRWN